MNKAESRCAHLTRFYPLFLTGIILFAMYKLNEFTDYYVRDMYEGMNMTGGISNSGVWAFLGMLAICFFVSYFNLADKDKDKITSVEKTLLKVRKALVIKEMSGVSYAIALGVTFATFLLSLVSMILQISIATVQVSKYSPLMEKTEWYGTFTQFESISSLLFLMFSFILICFPRKMYSAIHPTVQNTSIEESGSKKEKNISNEEFWSHKENKENAFQGLVSINLFVMAVISPIASFQSLAIGLNMVAEEKTWTPSGMLLGTGLGDVSMNIISLLLFIGLIGLNWHVAKEKIKSSLLKHFSVAFALPVITFSTVVTLGTCLFATDKTMLEMRKDKAFETTTQINGKEYTYREGILSAVGNGREEELYEVAIGHRMLVGLGATEYLLQHAKGKEQEVIKAIAKMSYLGNKASEQARNNLVASESDTFDMTSFINYSFMDIHHAVTHFEAEKEMMSDVMNGRYQSFLDNYSYYYLNKQLLPNTEKEKFYSSSGFRIEKPESIHKASLGSVHLRVITAIIIDAKLGEIDMNKIMDIELREKLVKDVDGFRGRIGVLEEDPVIDEKAFNEFVAFFN